MPLIPREEKYFQLLNQLVGNIRRGADLLVRLFADLGNNAANADQIKAVEKECDENAAAIIEKLNSSFITPIDREDIYTLTTELDDIMDHMNDMARLTVIYGMSGSDELASHMTRTLLDSVVELEKAFTQLESRKGVREHIEKIKLLEEEGDRAWQTAMQRLFSEEKDPIAVIKWSKIYDDLEAATDRCKDVAKVLEAVVVKNT
jgi:uncharacterized protein